MPFLHPRLVPFTVAQEPLQIAHLSRTVQLQGDCFDVLTLDVAQEALHVQFQQGHWFAPHKGLFEQTEELVEFPTDRFQIVQAQRTLRRELGFPRR